MTERRGPRQPRRRLNGRTELARGTLYVVSAPSGAGKTSLVKALIESVVDLQVSVSHTTRAPRSGERDGVHYHFVDANRFEQLLAEGAFVEHARVFDHQYGTSRAALMGPIEAGIDVVLEIDWQGARQVRDAFPASRSIFILPPSRAALEERLRGRGQDDEAVVQRRMRDAVAEMSHYAEYDFIVVNDRFELALHDLQAIVCAGRLQRARQVEELSGLLGELLG
jgi:guanylate kinase